MGEWMVVLSIFVFMLHRCTMSDNVMALPTATGTQRHKTAQKYAPCQVKINTQYTSFIIFCVSFVAVI